jgi:hypothetical protein
VSRRNFPDWIEAYLSLVRGRTEAPDVFHLWSAIATIGAAITRRIYIDEVSYKIYPNWIIILAAIPGRAKKSTTVDRCTELLRYNHSQLFGADETNWPDICRTLAENVSYIDVNAGHTDPDTDGGYATQCAMTFVPGELGTFLNPDDSHAIDGITRLWDCPDRPFIKSTKHSGVDNIVNPFFNLIGCTTTKWLKDNFSKYQGWGIASRIVFVHSDAANYPIWSPSREIPPVEWTSTREKLSQDLEYIMKLRGVCTFTPDAADLAKRWYDQTFAYLVEYDKKHDADPWLADFLARKQIHVHKLAMTLSISRRDSLIITYDDYVEAIDKIEQVQKETEKVFRAHVVTTTAASNERAIYDLIHAELSNGLGGKAPKSYILNRISMYVDGATAERVLSSFIRRKILTEEQSKFGFRICLPTKE